MRISSNQIWNTGLQSIIQGQQRLTDIQQSVSTGKRINKASDDPLAVAKVQILQKDLNLAEQYQTNIKGVTNRLELEENTVNAVYRALDRVRELTLQVGSGVQTPETRSMIAEEVEQRLNEIIGLFNTKDGAGDYLFSGYAVKTEPFARGSDGQWHYLGDSGQQTQQVASDTFVATSDSGFNLFVDIPSAQYVAKTEAHTGNTGSAIITDIQISDQAAFDSAWPEDYIVEFRPLAESTPPGNPNFTVRQKSDDRVVGGMQNITHSSPQAINFNGLSFNIEGPANPGDIYFVRSSDKQDIPTAIENLVEGLRQFDDTPASQARISQLLDDSIANIDSAQQRISEVQAKIGARLNTVESVQYMNEDLKLSTQKVISQIEDVDFAEALSNLSFQSFVLQAAQQSYSQITGLSLFNFLR